MSFYPSYIARSQRFEIVSVRKTDSKIQSSISYVLWVSRFKQESDPKYPDRTRVVLFIPSLSLFILSMGSDQPVHRIYPKRRIGSKDQSRGRLTHQAAVLCYSRAPLWPPSVTLAPPPAFLTRLDASAAVLSESNNDQPMVDCGEVGGPVISDTRGSGPAPGVRGASVPPEATEPLLDMEGYG
jgi:hypothetical protein